MHKEKNKKEKKEERVKIRTVIFSLVFFLVAIIIFGGLPIYFKGVDSFYGIGLFKTFPYPVAVIGFGNFITVSQLGENFEAVRGFYEKQGFDKIGGRVDFSGSDGGKRWELKKKEILNKMIEDKLVIDIAKKYGIKLSDKEIKENVKRVMSEYGSDESEVRKSLLNLYGWSLEDFEQKVVKADLYSEELQKKYAEEEKRNFNALRQKISLAEESLKSGNSFDEAAKLCMGDIKQDDIDLGWFEKKQIISEIAQSVFDLKKGEISGILESSLGFHIIKIEDLKQENGENFAKIKQIYLPKKTFGEWLQEKISSFRVKILLPEYEWDSRQGAVVFSSAEMRDFEKNFFEEN